LAVDEVRRDLPYLVQIGNFRLYVELVVDLGGPVIGPFIGWSDSIGIDVVTWSVREIRGG
jgi:hypothetical protein